MVSLLEQINTYTGTYHVAEKLLLLLLFPISVSKDDQDQLAGKASNPASPSYLKYSSISSSMT